MSAPVKPGLYFVRHPCGTLASVQEVPPPPASDEDPALAPTARIATTLTWVQVVPPPPASDEDPALAPTARIATICGGRRGEGERPSGSS